MCQSAVLSIKNFLRLILKFSKIGLKKLSENLKKLKNRENFNRWCDRRDLKFYYAFKFILNLFVYNYTIRFKDEQRR